MSETNVAFKIVARSEWESQIASTGKFKGAGIDIGDGYIHLSTLVQVRETALKWFVGKSGLVLICVDLRRVEGEVRWETSRNNQLFPHVYGTISPSSIVWMVDLPVSADGKSFDFPPEVTE